MESSAREHNKSRANKALFTLPGAAQTHRIFVVLNVSGVESADFLGSQR